MSDPRATGSPSKGILFFDGDCGLCNRSVRFLMKQDRSGHLRFAPIQGSTAQSCLPLSLRDQCSSAVYQKLPGSGEGRLLIRSEAMLCALIDTGSLWAGPARVARLLPVSWRDAAYRWVARNRHRFFSKRPCALPSESEKARFLP